jgi:8-oxo-dGTP diphosphatase
MSANLLQLPCNTLGGVSERLNGLVSKTMGGCKPHASSNLAPTATMIKQYSAGGIVYKKLQITSDELRVLWLICQHAQHNGWVFPKGIIGDSNENESIEDTALREVKEETGIDAELIKKIPTNIEYLYQFKGEKYFKTVYYYLMKYKGGDFKLRDHEMQDVRWATEEEVKKILTYKNDLDAFEEALTLYNAIS